MVGSQLQSEVTPLDVLVRALPNLPGPLQQSLLCQLLRTSSSVAAAIYKHCLGKLSLSFSTYDINTLKGTFLPWLSKHGCLLSSLSLQLNLSNSLFHEAETAVVSALQKASSSAATALRSTGNTWCSPPGLQMFSCHPAIGPALDQLDSWYLQRLEVGRHAPYSCSFALTTFTRLCRLTLFEDSADVLLPSLAGLTALTRLSLVDVADAASISKLKWVPPQVLEMQLSLARLKKTEELPPGLNLAHLTALTKLTNGDSKPLLIQAGDSLPPALQVLAVRDVLDVGPLLQLPNLTHLSMCASTTPAEQLALLGGSSCGSSGGGGGSSGGVGVDSSGSKAGLRSVSMCYGDMQAAAAAAAGWPLLPLDRLELRAAEGRLPAHTIDMLGRLPKLRKLEVYGGGCRGFAEAAVFEASQQQLAGVIRNLTRLEVLGLRGFGLLPDTVTAAAANGHHPAAAPAGSAAAGAAVAAVCAGSHDSGTFSNSIEAALCAHTNNLSLSSSYDSNGSGSHSGDACEACGGASSSNGMMNGGSSVTSPITSPNSSGHGQHRDTNGVGLCSQSSGGGCCDDTGSLQPLLEAVASLPNLGCLTVSSVSCGGQVLSVDEAAAVALGAASKLTCLQLTDTQLTDAAVNALVTSGLTRLRRLAVDNNPKVTAEVLPDELVARLTGLRELGVLRTGIRGAAAVHHKARMLRANPNLHVKSPARG